MTLIALFGTSADPPTTGHQAILEWLSQHFDWVAVWASDNPFKAHRATLGQRQEMLRLLIEDMHPSGHNVALYPQLSDPKALTTLKRARQCWSDAAFAFVIGSDLVPKLFQWYQIAAVLSQVQLLVIPRPGYPLQARDLRQLQQQGAKVTIANFTGPDVSSTAYREGNTVGLTPAVQAYVQQESLYAWIDAASSVTGLPGGVTP